MWNLALEKPQKSLRLLIGLCQHGDAGLDQNLLAGEMAHLGSDVEIQQITSGRFGIFQRRRNIDGREFQPVLGRPQIGSRIVKGIDGPCNGHRCRIGLGFRGDVRRAEAESPSADAVQRYRDFIRRRACARTHLISKALGARAAERYVPVAWAALTI